VVRPDHLIDKEETGLKGRGTAAGHGQKTYRGLVVVRVLKGASGARNDSQCDSLLLGDKCDANQLFYCRQRGNGRRKIQNSTP
jgi:Fe-S cluster assembly protein SufB